MNETTQRRERVAGRAYAAEVFDALKQCDLDYQEGFYRAILERIPIHILQREQRERRNRKHGGQ